MKRRRQFIILSARDKIYFRVVLPALLIIVVACLAIVGFLFYRINFPSVAAEEQPSKFLVKGVTTIQGADVSVWFLKGAASAPGIFVCPDYGQNRLSLLNMASIINDQGYNVFVVAMRGQGQIPGGSTLGLKEGADVVSAIETSLVESGVAPDRLAVYGVGLGAHAAMKAALLDDRIKVLILDSPYPAPSDLLEYELRKETGFKNRILRGAIGILSALYAGRTPRALYEPVDPQGFRDVTVLYLVGEDDADFRQWAMELHAATPGTKAFHWLPKTRRTVLDTPGWRAYDLKIAEFLKAHFPVKPPPPEKPVKPPKPPKPPKKGQT
jgi:pimeloyl-ACP methyl ester carboxylesterase